MHEPEPTREQSQPEKCPVCSGSEFEWGILYGAYYGTTFSPLTRIKNPKMVKVRRCLRCNNLLQFVADERLLKDWKRDSNRTGLIVLALIFFFTVFLLLAFRH